MYFDGDYKSSVLNQLAVIRMNIQLGNKTDAAAAVDELAAFVREGSYENQESISVRDDSRFADCVGV